MEAKDYLENHWIKNKIWTHLEWPKHQDRFRACVSYLEGKRFIDIGCGLGHSTNILKKFLPGNWSGLEFMQEAVDRAKELFPDISFYYSKDFNFLPTCGQFDGVVCSDVIEHVENDKALIEGLVNITKKTLVITTPNKRVNDPGHLRLYDENLLSRLFSQYKNVEIKKIGLFFYIIWRKQ